MPWYLYCIRENIIKQEAKCKFCINVCYPQNSSLYSFEYCLLQIYCSTNTGSMRAFAQWFYCWLLSINIMFECNVNQFFCKPPIFGEHCDEKLIWSALNCVFSKPQILVFNMSISSYQSEEHCKAFTHGLCISAFIYCWTDWRPFFNWSVQDYKIR